MKDIKTIWTATALCALAILFVGINIFSEVTFNSLGITSGNESAGAILAKVGADSPSAVKAGADSPSAIKKNPVGSDSGSCADSSSSGVLCNPLESASITEFIMKIIDIILVFAIPIIVLYIMYAGFLYVTAQGDSGKVRDAQNALTWAVVGGVIVLGAKLLIEIIQGTVNSL